MISRWVPVVRSENGHGLATVDWERRETKRDADVDQKAEQLGGQAHARREQTGIWESRGVVWRAPPLVFTARREGRMEEEGKGVCGERRRSSEDDAATATTVDGISIPPKQQQITRTVSASLGLSPCCPRRFARICCRRQHGCVVDGGLDRCLCSRRKSGLGCCTVAALRGAADPGEYELTLPPTCATINVGLRVAKPFIYTAQAALPRTQPEADAHRSCTLQAAGFAGFERSCPYTLLPNPQALSRGSQPLHSMFSQLCSVAVCTRPCSNPHGSLPLWTPLTPSSSSLPAFRPTKPSFIPAALLHPCLHVASL